MAAKKHLSRREVLRGLSMGLLGGPLVLDSVARAGVQSAVLASRMGISMHRQGVRLLWTPVTTPAKVSLVKGNDRRQIVFDALKQQQEAILASIGDRPILIKPNMVTTKVPLCATHVDAVRAILDFLKPHYKQQIIIGESSAFGGPTTVGFETYGYLPLEKEYNVRLVDLNTRPWEYRYVFGNAHAPIPIRIIKAFLDPNLYVISAARMKTHDRVVTTLSIKNVVLGSPINDGQNDKPRTHAVYQFKKETELHYNMFHLAQEIYPDLSVIDGFEAMEGDGPVGGTPVDMRVALASLDPLAADKVATKLMGFDPDEILYLRTMTQAGMGQGDLARIELLGGTIEQCQRKFKPHKRMAEAYGFPA